MHFRYAAIHRRTSVFLPKRNALTRFFSQLCLPPRVGFESLTEKIETSSASGKLIFHVFASLAEFERNLIRERTRAGLDAARARGRIGGRTPKLDERQVREIRAMLRDPQVNVSDVARRYGVSRTTIYTWVGVVKPERSAE